MAEEEALLRTLERLRSGPLQPGGLSSESVVITGSGFAGQTRLSIRELAALAGFSYSGDLARGRTTHLVLLRTPARPAGSATGTAVALPPPTGAASSRKLECARLWGIPCVRLAWLLESCEAGQALPVQPFLEPASGKQQSSQAAKAQDGRGGALHTSCRQLTQRARPSSVASNAPGAELAGNVQQTARDSSTASPAEQQPHQQPGKEQPSHTGRSALAPVANLLADQLRHMSISPEPRGALAAAGHCPGHGQAQRAQPQPQPIDSPPLQRSPSLLSSPQQSLSLQGLVEAAEAGRQAGHLAAASVSSMHIVAGSQQDSGPEQLHGDCCMQHSPATGTLALCFSSSRTRADDLPNSSPVPGGSPMPGDSPMADWPAVRQLPSQNSRGTEASLRRPPSVPVGTPAAEGSPLPMCTLPTPACVRDWSDDGSMTASPDPTYGQ